MTKAVVLGCRNDGYKEDERVVACLNSMIDTFDQVWFCDWNSPSSNGPLLWKLGDQIPKIGKIRHFIINENAAKILTNYNDKVSPYAFILAQNLMIRRCDADWITSTAMDIVAPKKEYLDNFISKANKDTFYTISRREAEYKDLEEMGFDNWKQFRDKLDQTSEPRFFPAKVTPNDEYSIFNCCGDFQLATKNLWFKIRGYEEPMLYSCFVDTNAQKKDVLYGFDLIPIYDVPLYHMSHKNHLPQGGNTENLHEAANKKPPVYNDAWDWVETFDKYLEHDQIMFSRNADTWGFSNIEIEHETI